MGWIVWGAMVNSQWADLCSFFAVLRLFRLIYGVPKLMKSRKVRDTSGTHASHSSHSIDCASHRILDLLKLLLSDAYLQHDPHLIEEIQWSIDVISSNSLIDPGIVSHNENLQFKEKDLMNLVMVFSTAQMSAGLGKQRASSFLDQIPLNQLDVSLPSGTLDCLSKVDTYDFNVFTLKAVTDRNELRTLMHIFFAKTGLFLSTGIDQELFSNFVERVQKGYIATNPYHNATHAADVLQAFHFYLEMGGGVEWLDLTPVELAGCYLAAGIHDYEHPGVNNSYLINTQAELAIRYNDRSVLENHHVSSALSLTLTEEYDFLAPLPREDFQRIRSLLIELVLNTDPTQHFILMSKFKGKSLMLGSGLKGEDKMIGMTMLLHAADISNASRPWELCRKWTTLVMEEFWIQGDKERDHDLPISYLMDKFTVNVAKSQIGFIDVIVEPLFRVIFESLPCIETTTVNLATNRSHWQANIDVCEQELAARQKSTLSSPTRPVVITSEHIA